MRVRRCIALKIRQRFDRGFDLNTMLFKAVFEDISPLA